MATIKYKDENGVWKELTVLKGDSGVAPIINPDTNTWLVWDNEQGVYVDTGVVAGVGTEDFYASTYWVFNEMASGKKVIAKALTDRRYPTSNDESFVDMADKITNMSYEEGWFAKIGYTDDNDGGIKKAIDYSYELAKGWNPDGSTPKLFSYNTSLVFFPMVETSNVLNATEMLRGTKIIFLPNLNLDNATDFTNFLSANMNIKYIGKIKSSRGKAFNSTFHQNHSLFRLEEIDFQSATNTSNVVYQCSALVYALIKNIGKSTLATYDFSGASVWGTGSEENRQSLIDSLITYSYDRASNGMATATIKLSANTKALLTEEEIAQITAKGFSLA